MQEHKGLYMQNFPKDSEKYVDFFLNKFSHHPENVISYFEDDKLISAGYIVEKPSMLMGIKTIVPYLSAISTLNEYKGKQKARCVVEKALKEVYKRGYELCALFPFDYNYYTRYGFETISFASKKLIEGGKDIKTRIASGKELGIVLEIEKEFAKKFDNYLISDEIRAKDKYNEYLCDNIPLRILSDKGEDFSFYYQVGDHIDFLITLDDEKLSCAQCLKGIEFRDYFGSSPYVQGRIVNIQKLLKRCKYEKVKKTVCFSVVDDLIEENNQSFKVSVDLDNVTVEKIAFAESTFTINQMTDMIFNGGLEIFAKNKNFFVDKF